MERSVLHMDLDSFFVSVERLRNSQLSGIPLIIGGASNRGVVAACSYEARTFGVASAMPMKQARKLCPQATIISGDMDAYSKYSSLVTDVIHENAPMYEKASIDEFYLDLSGMDKFFGCFKWSHELRSTITKETGLPISFGLSKNKTVSKVATNEAKPDGEKYIQSGNEKPFLFPLPIQRIPMLGEKTAIQLRSMGVRKVQTLAETPPHFLQQLFGKHGLSLWKKANAEDDSPVQPYSDAKSISKETTFQQDTIDVKYLRSVLIRQTERIAFKLRESGKVCACIAVKLRYSNFDTVSKQVHIAYTANDKVLIQKVLELFEKLYERRMLVRLVGVRFSKLVHGSFTINLFDDTHREINLLNALDNIRMKYGDKSVGRAIGFT